jgi:hypothetical protein
MLGSTWLARHPALRAAIVRYRGEADAAAAAAAAMPQPSVEEAPARDEGCDVHAPTTPTTPPAELLFIAGGARRPRSLGDIAAALRLAIGPVAALHAGTAEPGGEHMCCSRRQAEIVELARAVGAAEWLTGVTTHETAAEAAAAAASEPEPEPEPEQQRQQILPTLATVTTGIEDLAAAEVVRVVLGLPPPPPPPPPTAGGAQRGGLTAVEVHEGHVRFGTPVCR